ncbi:unnamed protein product [Echinostoma caproni]|uniref:Protein ORF8 n=1 Tax=Echinostoma caproni TaxID=27848 RepID=A0A183ATT7_9TREM|nr:unnamed protein product [Echinostoma caproni]
MLSVKAERSLLDWVPVSSRLCAVRLDGSVRINSYRTKRRCLFVLSAYAPTDYSMPEISGTVESFPTSVDDDRCVVDTRFSVQPAEFVPPAKLSSINSQLLTNRAASIRVAYQHLCAAKHRLLKRCTYVHRLHKNYAEALCQWCPYEAKSMVVADAFQIAGHELDSFSSLMDPGEEEEAELVEKSKKLLIPPRQFQDPKDCQSTHMEKRDPQLISQMVASACVDVLRETLHFESVHESELNDLFHAYACLQLRRAERCKRMWERVHASLLRAAEGISLSHSSC